MMQEKLQYGGITILSLQAIKSYVATCSVGLAKMSWPTTVRRQVHHLYSDTLTMDALVQQQQLTLIATNRHRFGTIYLNQLSQYLLL